MLYFYLSRLVEKAYVKAYYHLGLCLSYGYGCEIDIQAARELLLKAFIFKSYPDNFRENFEYYYHVKDYFDEYIDATETARNYFYGANCSQNYQNAFNGFAIAFIKDEDAYAGCMLGDIFFNGLGVKSNIEVALECYKRCHWGITLCDYDDYFEMMPEYKIGMCLLNGIGTQKNKRFASYFLGCVADYYKKPENDIPEKYANEINNAIKISDELFCKYGYDFEEEAEAWLEQPIEYATK